MKKHIKVKRPPDERLAAQLQTMFDTMFLKFIMAGFGVECGTHSPTELPHAVMFRDDIAVRIIQHTDRVEVKVQFAFLESDDSENQHILN